jgi:hypothetical protein
MASDGSDFWFLETNAPVDAKRCRELAAHGQARATRMRAACLPGFQLASAYLPSWLAGISGVVYQPASHAALAQLVERQLVELDVVGSSPTGGTILEGHRS